MKTQEQTGASTTLQWLGHASFRIRHESVTIYIDPWKLSTEPHDADIVLISHGHFDHYSSADIAKVKGEQTQVIASSDVVAAEKSGQVLKPGQTTTAESVNVTAVPAYNPNKRYHPKDNDWLGFVVEVGPKRIYYAGDTDMIEPMKALGHIDVALLPVGGTYTMNAEEAAEAARQIQPELAIPYHWGDVAGSRADAERFAERCQCRATIPSAGETITLD